MEGSGFPCSSCGICCRKLPEWFPYQEDGVCRFLEDDNSCGIYDERPIVCRVDAMASVHEIPKPVYYRMTAQICNRWMDEADLPPEMRVEIGE